MGDDLEFLLILNSKIFLETTVVDEPQESALLDKRKGLVGKLYYIARISDRFLAYGIL